MIDEFITKWTIGVSNNIAGNYLYYKDDSGKINLLKVQFSTNSIHNWNYGLWLLFYSESGTLTINVLV